MHNLAATRPELVSKGTREIWVILNAKETSFRSSAFPVSQLVVFSRDQLKRAVSLTEEDFVKLGKCRPTPPGSLTPASSESRASFVVCVTHDWQYSSHFGVTAVLQAGRNAGFLVRNPAFFFWRRSSLF